ncbi:MAG TPA: FG-GAP-like repeat-containing protein [Blastocatellia bacterium]|nr:FG-GAP-like repeat-containing protein [Blastocatellia bacterium]
MNFEVNPAGAFYRATILIAFLLTFNACDRNPGLPKPDSKEYRDLVTAFYVGLAGLQTGEDVRAKEKLTRATEIAPGEPAGWANLGLLAVRQQEFNTAFEKVEKARSLAPENSQIEALLGLIESRRGNLTEAAAHLKKAVELDPKNLRALYALAQETERQGAETSDAEAQALLQKILESQPDNLAVLLDVTRLAAKRGDGETLRKTVAKLAEKSPSWPEEATQQMTALQQAAAGPNPRSAAPQVAFLRNVLARVPDYRQSLNAVKTPAEFVGEPFVKFIKLPSPSSEPAQPDMAMTFSTEVIPGIDTYKAYNPLVVAFDSDSNPSLVFHDRNGFQIMRGAKVTFAKENPAAWGIAALDFNYDFKTDIVAVSDEGIRFYRQENINSFTDVTARTALPAKILNAKYSGVRIFDFDLDGDLDLLLDPNPVTTQPVVLRNNGDGTFKDLFPFEKLRDIDHFATADIDEDGDPDLAIVDEKGFKVLENERLGQYRERPVPQNLGAVIAIAVADINSDGAMDFVLMNRDGQILRLSDRGVGKDWEVAELTRIKIEPMSSDVVGFIPVPRTSAQLLIADIDNNGSLDLVADTTNILLSDAQGKFAPVNIPADVSALAIDDVNNDGRLDLIGIQRDAKSGDNKPVQIINRGGKNYHYQTIRTRAAKATGDQRINSFGIGGEIEIRSGLLTQKQVITSPILHFGLGENTQTDVARIVWPNGSVQAEFELKADQSILAEQRLKGSCPMLFAWDGKQISYVKDTAPWSPALGLRINAQVVAGIYQTEEWFKIPGDRLAPRADASGSYYDLRVTAELWETFYIDHYSLMVVDHPQGTGVFTDERFAVPPPPLKLYATSEPRPFASAKDNLGQDVSAVVRDLDQKYLDTFGKGRYQGITRDHWVELEAPERDGPQPAQLYLIGHGFLHPTDGSINVAYGQSSYPPPQGLSIEVPDPQGKWVVAKSGLGFPAGKLKTIVLDLNNVFRPGAPRKLRLRTSMEIFWDKLEWAEGLPEATLKTQRIGLSSAELRRRGFSKFSQANDSSPELPDYNQIEGTSQKWRDLIGYYTRHGEVRELLEKIDDRMVIVCAGDEIRLKFAALPPPPAGWTRDYIMVGDGWIKDGDLNSTFSKTVLPLPYHGLKDYNTVPGRLEDDPAYKRNPQDWRDYHTRYVTPEFFLKALRQ